jgi:Na+/H+-dicarboxylate symporter
MNVPIALMGIILPFYSIIDMIETSLNVWSDACVVSVVNAKSEEEAVGASEYGTTEVVTS